MTFAPYLILIATPEAVTIANRIETSHNKMTKAAVLIWDGLSNTIPTKVSYSSTMCRLQMPNQQIVEMQANEIRFYDEIFNQVAPLKNPKPLKIPDNGAKVAIVQREPISWLLESSQRNDFFKEIKQDSRWRVRGSSLTLIDPKKKILSEVHFDNNYHVTQIKLSINGRALSDWRYRYVSDAEVPSIPSGAKVVKGLAPRPSIPQKTDGKTVLLAQKVWRAMSRLDGKNIVQVTDEGTYKLMYGKGKVAESGPKGSWTLINTQMVLTKRNVAAKTFNGGADKCLDFLRSSGVDVSPVSRYLLNRQIPFLDMFDRADEVKLLNGVVKLEGKSLSMLSMKKGGVHIRMYVDPSTGRLAKVSSDSIDQRGNIVSGAQLKISYQ